MASRFISILAPGTFEIAQAVIINISKYNKRVKNIGYATISASLGFVVGLLITSKMLYL